MAPAAARPTKMDRVVSVGRWLKTDFAEWVVGSWALILGWLIVTVIFFSFLQMDGYFSRGLGEGSGVDSGLFQNIGWMFRLFVALFLVLAVKLTAMGMGSEARWVKVLGVIGAVIVVAHAMGFGLKALHGKYANATSIEAVAETVTQSNDQIISTLTAQKQSILDVLAVQTAPLDAEIQRLDTDGRRNEDLANVQKARRAEMQDVAQVKIDAIDAQILQVMATAGQHKADTTRDIATAEPWPPLYVGLAQLFTWSEQPTDGQIFLAGVLFLMAWILFGDSICIYLPHALYKMHLKDAKPRKVSIDPGVFANLQEQADELARRKAALDEGVDKALKTKGRKRRRAEAIRMIEDQRQQSVRKDEVELEPEMSADESQEAAGEDFEEGEGDEPETLDDAPDAPEAPEDDTQQDKAA